MSYEPNLHFLQGLTYRYTKTGINGLSSGATLIATSENAGRRFYPLVCIAQVTAISSLISVATLTIGTNAITYNDIATLVMTGADAVNKYLPVPVISAISSVAPNTGIYANVSSIAVAGTYTITVHIIGFYL